MVSTCSFNLNGLSFQTGTVFRFSAATNPLVFWLSTAGCGDTAFRPIGCDVPHFVFAMSPYDRLDGLRRTGIEVKQMPQPQPAPPKSKAPQAKPKVQAQPFTFAATPKSADGSSYGTDHALADEPPPQPIIPQSAGELHAMTAQAAADYEKYLKNIFDRNGNAAAQG